MMPYRVLIADDHPLARKAIQSLLADEPGFLVVGEAVNGEETVKACSSLLPDLVLMDINMPIVNGLEATRLIKLKHPMIRIVILTVSDHVADLFAAIQFGAQGYLLKNMDPQEWMMYLHALLDESSSVSHNMADKLFHQFRTGNGNDETRSNVLTSREKEILVCISSGDSNRQIAKKLIITENTVKNHIKNILSKLSLDNRVQLTAFAVRNGLSQSGQS